MVEEMKKIAEMDKDLSIDERNSLSVAYKNVIGSRRAAWRIVSSLETKVENDKDEFKLQIFKEYRKKVGKYYIM